MTSARTIPDLAAIDEVCTFFENKIAAISPLWEPERKFHLLGERDGMLAQQPKNENFFRQFDVISTMDAPTFQSYLPLERGAVPIWIQIGYLGSVRNRYLRKIVRQDEEKIAVELLSAKAVDDAPVGRPFNWDFRPPPQRDELGEDGAATIITLVYEVYYVCGDPD